MPRTPTALRPYSVQFAVAPLAATHLASRGYESRIWLLLRKEAGGDVRISTDGETALIGGAQHARRIERRFLRKCRESPIFGAPRMTIPLGVLSDDRPCGIMLGARQKEDEQLAAAAQIIFEDRRCGPAAA